MKWHKSCLSFPPSSQFWTFGLCHVDNHNEDNGHELIKEARMHTPQHGTHCRFAHIRTWLRVSRGCFYVCPVKRRERDMELMEVTRRWRSKILENSPQCSRRRRAPNISHVRWAKGREVNLQLLGEGRKKKKTKTRTTTKWKGRVCVLGVNQAGFPFGKEREGGMGRGGREKEWTLDGKWVNWGWSWRTMDSLQCSNDLDMSGWWWWWWHERGGDFRVRMCQGYYQFAKTRSLKPKMEKKKIEMNGRDL